jgi:hypothetical protein
MDEETLTQPGVLTIAVVNNPIQCGVSALLRDLPVEAFSGGVYVVYLLLQPKL